MDDTTLYKAIIQQAILDLQSKRHRKSALEYLNSELFIEDALSADLDVESLKKYIV
jgi:hypothetical protein